MNRRTILIIILAVVFAAFSPALDNEFTNWDDQVHFTENADVASLGPASIKNMFINTVNGTYIPLTTLSFALEYYFFGLNPFASHLINLLLHLAITALVFQFALKMNTGLVGASIAALFFGVHPMHVESVAWITERKDVLYGLFYMLSLIHYLEYADTKGRRWLALSVFWALLSILSKAMALSLPFALLACDWLRKRPVSRSMFIDKIPYFLAVVPIALITYALNARVIEHEAGQSFLIWIWSLGFYVHKFLFPVGLSPLYELPKPVLLTNGPYLFACVFVIANLLAIIFLRKLRWFRFAWLFYFLSVFFLLRYDDAADISIVADRFMYLPSLGFCLLFGVLCQKAWKRMEEKSGWAKNGSLAAMGVFILGLSACTFAQVNVWQDSVTLWTEVIRHNKTSALAHYNLGKSYDLIGRPDKAMGYYDQAIQLKGDYADAYSNRGYILLTRGDLDGALEDFNRAIKHDSQSVEGHNNRGSVYYTLRQYELALADFDKTIAIDPDYSRAYNNRGLVYTDKKLYKMALSNFDQAINRNPEYIDAYYNRGNVFRLLKQHNLALSDYNKALDFNSDYLKAYINRGNTYSAMGNHKEAIESYTQALRLDPSIYEIYSNRGVAHHLNGQFDLALYDFNMAIKLKPDFLGAYAGRGNLFNAQGQYERAIEDYSRALDTNPDQAIVHFHRSMAYASLKQYSKALADAQKAKELGYPNLLVYIAKLGKLMGQ